jgi:hypothetical protein
MNFVVTQPPTEVLRLSKDGLWANPDIPADDAAKLVLKAIDANIKVLVQKAVEEEREACAQVCEARVMGDLNREDQEARRCAEAIRKRGDE